MFVFIVVMVLMFVFIVVMVLMFVFIVVMMFMFMLIVMVMMFMFILHGVEKLLHQDVFLLHSSENLLAVQLIPGGCDDDRLFVVSLQAGSAFLQLFRRNLLAAAEDNGIGGFNLIVEEFAEIFHIHFAFDRVYHSGGAVEVHRFAAVLYPLYCPNYVGKLADTGGLNNYPVGGELVKHLPQRLPEVPHQGAADAAGIHLRNLNTGILQKSAVDANLAKFVFNQHQLFPLESLLNQLFNQGGFSGPQKTGDNVYFSHIRSAFP